MIKEQLTLNANIKSVKQIIHATQGENGARVLDITVIGADGEILSLAGCIVSFYVAKNDGQIAMLPATISENTASVVLTEQACSTAGDNSCWLQIVKAGEKAELRVDNFVLRVQACDFDGAVESSSEFGALGQLIADASEAISNTNDAISNTNAAAEEARTTAATTAANTVNGLKGKPGGIASLNASGELEQMPSVSKLFLAAYPVGALFFTTTPTNPGALFGGTWVAYAPGRVLVGVDPSDDDFNIAEKTGGAKTHILTVAETPPHEHERPIYWSRAAGNTYAVPQGLETNDPRQYQGVSNPTSSVGGGQPHNNLQPYITCYMWKRIA